MAVTGGKTARTVEFTHVDKFESIKDLVSFLSTCDVSIEDVDGINFSMSKGVEVTVKSVKKYNEFMQKLLDLEEVDIIRSSEIYTVVTLHNVPFELELRALFAKMREYGTILDHVKCTHEEFPTIHNGIYKFKMELKSFPPSNFVFGHRNVMVNFPGQSRECLKCGQTGHMIKNCTSDPKCRNCGVVGHRARDCTSDVLCSICHLSGHKYEECPKTVDIVDVPSSVGGSWAKVVARRNNRGGTRNGKPATNTAGQTQGRQGSRDGSANREDTNPTDNMVTLGKIHKRSTRNTGGQGVAEHQKAKSPNGNINAAAKPQVTSPAVTSPAVTRSASQQTHF